MIEHQERFVIRLLNLSILCGVMLSLVAMIYTSTRAPYYPPGWTSKYYVIFGSVSLLLGLTLTLKNSWKVNILLVAISSLVGLYGTELVLASFAPLVTDMVSISKKEGRVFDIREKSEVLRSFRMQGISAYPSIHPELFIKSSKIPDGGALLLPLSGISKSLVVYCNESGNYSVYPSDEFGFNNPLGIHQSLVYSIVLGDSFVQGACVPPGQDLTSHLRANGISAINLGADGNGPLLELATLREYGARLRPKVVIWVYFEGNDLTNLASELASATLRSYLDPGYSQNLIERQGEIDERLRSYTEHALWREKQRKYWSLPLWLKLHHLRSRLSIDHVAPLAEFERVLQTAIDHISSWGGKLYFVYLPDWQRYGLHRQDEQFHDRANVISLIRRLKLPLIDIHDIFSTMDNPLQYYPYGMNNHFTEDGYKRIAEEIARNIPVSGGIKTTSITAEG